LLKETLEAALYHHQMLFAYEQEARQMNTSATADTIDLGKNDYAERTHQKYSGCQSKSKWSKLEIASIVGGFIVFWPVGILALGAKLVNGEIWPGSKHNTMPWTAYSNWRAEKGEKTFGFASQAWSAQAGSGNAAFDTYKKQQLDRLEAERRKLDEEQKAFAEHLTKLRRAKDQEEFDRFMAERSAPKPE
jgi:Protein of unknown function (DUF2852)